MPDRYDIPILEMLKDEGLFGVAKRYWIPIASIAIGTVLASFIIRQHFSAP